MGRVRYTIVDGEVLSENRDGVKLDYVPDPLGSTLSLLNSSQVQVGTSSYWPYGEGSGGTGTFTTRYRYGGTLGYYYDNSERTYVRARQLHTVHARWMTQDPIEFTTLGHMGNEHTYAYALNNPINYIDPDGTRPKPALPREERPKPDARNCVVRVCSQYGFYDSDKWYDREFITHQYVCAVTYAGRTCTGGLYAGQIGDEGVYCGTHIRTKDKSFPVRCEDQTTDCYLASVVCLCIDKLRKNPPEYKIPFSVCWHMKNYVNDCVFEATGRRPFDPPFRPHNMKYPPPPLTMGDGRKYFD